MEEQGRSSSVRPLQIGDEVINFTADSHLGMVTLHDLIDGSWGIILTYPRNKDPVACTELAMLAKLQPEFDARKCKTVAVAVDSRSGHRAFVKQVQELQGCQVNFPLVADAGAEIFEMYGLVRPDAVEPTKGLLPQTCVYVVDLDKRVRLVSQYPSSVGQNYYELLRAIDAIQVASFHPCSIPANWKEGDDVFISTSVASNSAAQMFPKGFVEIKPWFRLTPQPNLE